MSLISKSNLFTESWTNIYNIINTRSNVADPTGSTSRKFVYSRVPNIKANFQGFPYIVLNQPSISMNRASVNAKRKNVIYALEIEVHTSDKFQNGSINGAGQTHLNQISDDLYETFNSSTIRSSLSALGIENINITTNNVDIDTEHEEIVWIRGFTLNFNNKLDVN